MKLDIVFVCQQGELEPQAALLAASLRRHCDDRVYLHVIEPIPPEEYGTISPVTRNFLDDMGAKWYQFRNPISDDYKVFNKLNAFNIRPEGDRILFLDSDIVIRKSLEGLSAYSSRPFAAKCGFSQAYSANAEDWAPIYRLFDLPVPRMQWPASDSHQWGPPYFSAAAILVDPKLDFSKHWIEACATIHQHAESLRLEKLGTAQLGLPVAVHLLNIPYALLDRRFNFALTKRRLKGSRDWGDNEGYVYHYGNASRMMKDPYIPYEVNEIARSFKLEEVFSLLPAWQRLLVCLDDLDHSTEVHAIKPPSSLFTLSEQNGKPTAGKREVTRPASRLHDDDFEPRMAFVTGIPQGGVDHFASLLRQLPNVTVLEEPNIKADFMDSPSIEGFKGAWSKWRKEMESGQDSHILAAKHTLGFLPRLKEIAKTFPRATIFVVVRHPFDTIASWRNSPYLSEGRIIAEDEWVGMRARHLAQEHQDHLLELRHLDDPAMKRAGLWDYFACLAHLHAERLQLLRYEDIVVNPMALLEHVHDALFPDAALTKFEFSSPQEPLVTKCVLSEWEKECIRAACSYNAGAFGYDLYCS